MKTRRNRKTGTYTLIVNREELWYLNNALAQHILTHKAANHSFSQDIAKGCHALLIPISELLTKNSSWLIGITEESDDNV